MYCGEQPRAALLERLVTADENQIGSGLENPSDETLVAATLGGDEQAFAHLVRRYLRKAMAVALEYVGTREDAEDVVQDTFRRVLESLDRFNPGRSFEPWFFTILRNTARNAAKSRRIRDHDALSAEQESIAPGPFEQTHRGELHHRIGAAIERLPPMQRTCFRLCLVEGFSSAEAASAIGLAESTVRVHVFKARQTLQQLLAGWRDELEEA
ncbi:MAG TPA: RNA polymerase sigma factor [Gemmatimonadales bacterium]